jgi:prolyl-tRNA editing enzyme YbaK/EbsC (Cys-tRNA(Pro) deacylase)
MHPNVASVQEALAAAGAQGQVIMLPDAVSTAALAAEALDVEVGQIANSLIFNADEGPLLVLTSGAHRVDTTKVATLLGYASVKRAAPEFVREHTGQPIGGVAPVGHPKPIPTLVDVHLGTFPVIWAAGGIPHAVFPTTFDELVRVTGGTPAEVA